MTAIDVFIDKEQRLLKRAHEIANTEVGTFFDPWPVVWWAPAFAWGWSENNKGLRYYGIAIDSHFIGYVRQP